MSEERKNTEIGLGEKCDAPAEGEIIKTVSPEEDEVGGRYRRWNNVICPHCYVSCRILEETTYRMRFSCWRCGNTFVY